MTNWPNHVFEYCERGGSIAFWAEPLNALSNACFIIAGLAAAVRMEPIKSPALLRGFSILLTVMLFVIGFGSFLFHTFATQWAELADTPGKPHTIVSWTV